MRNRLTVPAVLLLILLPVFLMGCNAVAPKRPEAPSWVTKGTCALRTGSSRVFYGVGSSSGKQDPASDRFAADNRACAEIAKIFKIYIRSVLEESSSSRTQAGPGDPSREDRITQCISTFTTMQLKGIAIIGHWRDPESGEIYSLAKWDLARFEDHVKNSGVLSDIDRRTVMDNADRAFEELEKNPRGHGQGN